MRLLLVDADHFSYSAVYESEKSNSFCYDGDNRKERYTDCLVVNVAVEKDDNEDAYKSAITEIENIARLNNNTSIVILPNVHLTNKPTKPEYALKILKKIYSRIGSHDQLTAHLEPFGYTGKIEIVSREHTSSVLGRIF